MPISTSTYPPLVRVRWNRTGYRSPSASFMIADEGGQKTVENPARCAPDRLVGQVEEVHLDRRVRGRPALGVMDAGRQQLREPDVEDPHHLSGVGSQRRARRRDS